MTPFTLGQRFKAPLRNGMKLFCVGVGASFVGVIVTNALIGLRQMLDPGFKPLNQPQNVLQTSAAYGAYMATSSNLRYQVRALTSRDSSDLVKLLAVPSSHILDAITSNPLTNPQPRPQPTHPTPTPRSWPAWWRSAALRPSSRATTSSAPSSPSSCAPPTPSSAACCGSTL